MRSPRERVKSEGRGGHSTVHVHLKSLQKKENLQKTLKRMIREVEEMAVFRGK